MATNETIYGDYPIYTGPAIADGKVYIGTSEHSPTQPRIRGNTHLCFDAFSGKILWNVSGALGSMAIADGYLLASSENDGMEYCFGKGQTETTVTMPTSYVTKGSYAWITGAVTDLSPAQPNTPVVPEEYMSSWMDSLHMQKPSVTIPTTAKGANVTLLATSSTGEIITIGTTNVDGTGNFRFKWTPPAEDAYIISAVFDGSASYWPSHGEASLVVGPASSGGTTPTATATSTATSSATTSPTTSPTGSASPSITGSPTSAPPPGGSSASTDLYIESRRRNHRRCCSRGASAKKTIKPFSLFLPFLFLF
jgi:hypothetical protein